MNIQSTKTSIGAPFAIFLMGLFGVLLWWQNGFILGGDSLRFGHSLPYLEIIFPLAGIAFLALFFTQAWQKKLHTPSKTQAAALVGFLCAISISSYFSNESVQLSFLWVILWAIGTLGFGITPTQKMRAALDTGLLFSGIIALFLTLFVPSIQLPFSILSAFATLATYDYFQKGKLGSTVVFGFLAIIFVLLSKGLGAGIFFIFTLVATPANRAYRSNKYTKAILYGLLTAGGVVTILQVPAFLSSLQLQSSIKTLATFPDWLFGVGPGQYFEALQVASSTYLLPEELLLSSSGILHFFTEYGVIALIFFTFLLLNNSEQKAEKNLLILAFVSYLTFSNEWVTTEMGAISTLFLYHFLVTSPPAGASVKPPRSRGRMYPPASDFSPPTEPKEA